MSVEQMREALKQRYPGPNWIYRVDHMTDQQVIAIYYRLLGSNNRS